MRHRCNDTHHTQTRPCITHALPQWYADANAEVKKLGYNIEDFDHSVYDMPQLMCEWAGGSTIPGKFVLMNNMCGRGTLLHELGHNYGLMHANRLDVTGQYYVYR